MKITSLINNTALMVTTILLAHQASAAIALDRTRIIFDGSDKAQSLSISNQNKELPYLAQGWIEDEAGIKIQSPLTVLPPVQRIEPDEKSQIKIQALPATSLLAQDRETLYYFNLREIPPKSDKANVLQIALQTRIKLFYRPAAIIPTRTELDSPWQNNLIMTRQGDSYQVSNPTPYFVTIVDAHMSSEKESKGKPFTPIMIAPKTSYPLGVSAASLGSAPTLTYINDYGGRPSLTFSCSGVECKVTSVKAG
ncbi:fimbria/pilus periplasmic chaperone [Hafnia alvei]|uniref:Molecular chaperone n=1 Tax=Hafnia alvei TaxID=569 RepID=A0ABD7Q7Y0_HAFAL|nr:fimbria/pilus periplasmic chaperone [Hafnia alvei]TBL69131.1 molecular chaperone [Hafnia alvei]